VVRVDGPRVTQRDGATRLHATDVSQITVTFSRIGQEPPPAADSSDENHPAQPSHEVRDELNVVVARGGYGLGLDPFTLSRYVCLTVRVISARQRLEPLIFGICSLSRMSGTLDRRRQRLVVLVDLVMDPSTSLFLLWVPLVSSGPGSYAAAPTTGAAWLDPGCASDL
jgi:hypothetical protein